MILTRSEQRLEQIKAINRPLTDEESDELRRSMHAVYMHERRHRMIQANRNEELALLERLRAEAQMPSTERAR